MALRRAKISSRSLLARVLRGFEMSITSATGSGSGCVARVESGSGSGFGLHSRDRAFALAALERTSCLDLWSFWAICLACPAAALDTKRLKTDNTPARAARNQKLESTAALIAAAKKPIKKRANNTEKPRWVVRSLPSRSCSVRTLLRFTALASLRIREVVALSWARWV